MAVQIPLTRLLVVAVGTLVAVSMAALLLVSFGRAVVTTQQLALERTEALLDHLQNRLQSVLDPILINEAEILAALSQGRLDLADEDALLNYIRGMVDAQPQLTGVALIGSDGRFWRYLSRTNTFIRDHIHPDEPDPDRRSVLEVTEITTPIWGDIVRSPSAEATLVNRTTFLGELDGVRLALAQVVSIEQISTAVASMPDVQNGTAFVLYGPSHVLAHPALSDDMPFFDGAIPLPTLDQVGDPHLAQFPDAQPSRLLEPLNPQTQISIVLSGQEEFPIFLTRIVTGYGVMPLTLGAHFLDSDADDNSGFEDLMHAAYVALAIVAVALAAAVLVGRAMARPVTRLTDAMIHVADGDLTDAPVIPHSGIRELDAARRAYGRMIDGLRERERVRNLFGKYVPLAVARSLLEPLPDQTVLSGSGDSAEQDDGALTAVEAEATVMFADLAHFTDMTERLGPARTVSVLNAYFSKVVAEIETEGGIVTQFQGDAVLAVFNVPEARSDYALAAVRAGRRILDLTAPNAPAFDGELLTARIGIATGPIIAGSVGAEGRLSYTVHGNTVNLAARLEAMNKPHGTRLLMDARSVGEARLDANQYRLVGSLDVRGLQEPVRVFTLMEADPGVVQPDDKQKNGDLGNVG